MEEKNTILIVDDEKFGREVLKSLLESQGYQLVFACSGHEALEKASRIRPDLILLDVVMPDLDGFEVCKRLRRDPLLAEVPIIMITGLEDRESRLQGIEAGADEFISKPFDEYELQTRIKNITNLNRYRRLLIERSKFKKIVELSPTGIAIIEADETIQLANPALMKLLEAANNNQIVGVKISHFIDQGNHNRFRRYLEKVFAGQPENTVLELNMLRKPDEPFPVEMIGGHLKWNESPAAQIIISDITERKRAKEKIQQQLHRLTVLHNIDFAISSSLNLKVIINILLEQITSQLNIDAASILMLDQDLQVLEYSAGHGFHDDIITQSQVNIEFDDIGTVIFEGDPLYIPDLTAGSGSFTRRDLVATEQFISYFAVPLIVRARVKGILELFHRSPFQSDAEWITFLETLGGQVTIALENAELFSNLEKSHEELIQAYDVTLEGWVRALDLRDKETEGHTQRVTKMTLRLAREMGMADDELVHIQRGALLHDIGKIGISDSILLKPGPLTDQEREIMEKHPTYAYEMLSAITYLRPALDIPYYHHEKYDGTGYPMGLKGKQIPLSARIFALIDVWDALSSDRPYRKKWPREKVLAYIKSMSKQHFDPEIVDIFLSLAW
ncbi:HD domain-containing phosphohydrolase [candidate division CSSED10-310 bacterium]|uniref:HD domain-containing phosphohydrolase n=1 Tax=candidate division CSSED10-310 bacterium TaxID=2855610 RepID=A0ABV6Z541_UNCC1